MTKKKVDIKKINRFILVIVALIFVFGLIIIYKTRGASTKNNQVFYTSPPSPQPLQTSRPITQVSATKKGWLTYVNNNYRYAIDVPPSSVLQQEDYKSNPPTLFTTIISPPNNVGVEIIIYDSKLGKIPSLTCLDRTNQTKIIKNGITGFMGKFTGGAEGQMGYQLCIEKDGVLFNVGASELNFNFSQTIINSFRFIN